MPILPIIASALASALLGRVISNALDGKEQKTASKDTFQLNVDQCSSAQKTDGVSKDTAGSANVKGIDDDSEDKIAKAKSANGAPALAAALDSQLSQSRVNQAGAEVTGAKSSANVGGVSSLVSTPVTSASKSIGAVAPFKASSSTGNPPFRPVQHNKAGVAEVNEWHISQSLYETGVLPENFPTDSAAQLMALYGVDAARSGSSSAVTVVA